MEQSGVPLLSFVKIKNRRTQPLPPAVFEVSLEPGLAPRIEIPVPSISQNEERTLVAFDLRPAPGRLRTVIEAEKARIIWRLVSSGEAIAQGSEPVEVLAYNEWPGARAPLALLATFAIPNHPVIATLLKRAAARLGAATGDGGITGYQLKSKKRAIEQVRALYETIQSLGISYIGLPASFETTGQKVRLADTLLAQQLGNCLDITLLFVSALEQMWLAPIIIILNGHAMPGVWLEDDRFAEGTMDDAARIRNQIALGKLLIWDSSTTVAAPPPAFETAIQSGLRHIKEDRALVGALDVRVLRGDRYRPLPIRMELNAPAGPDITNEREGGREVFNILKEAAAQTESGPRDAAPAPTSPDSISTRIGRWKDRLLDLSLRNRLLHFRTQAAGCIQLNVPSLAEFEDALAAQANFELMPAPDRESKDQRAAKLIESRVDLHDWLLAEMRARRLHTTIVSNELAPRARQLARDAKTALDEGGANTLYAALGTLRWFETKESPDPRVAPLLLIPVKLEYSPRTGRVAVRRSADESIGNITLAEKMRRDFGLDLGCLVEPETDDSGVDVARLLHSVRTGIQQMPRFEVAEDAYLGTFTFAKFLMWKDLEENAGTLLEHPVVRQIADAGRTVARDAVGAVDAGSLDDTILPSELPAVVDADSSQVAAIVSGMRGRNFILQGPPGTGKSQTITNLIAAAMHAGKSVLFVSEKMAALDVVFRRLQEAGLGDYCLELHSNKSNKKQVVDSLGKTYERSACESVPSWDKQSGALAERRALLNRYVRALHRDDRGIGIGFYRAGARSLALVEAPDVIVNINDPAGFSSQQFETALALAGEIQFSGGRAEPILTNPWRNSALAEWSGAREEELKAAIAQSLTFLREFGVAAEDLAKQAGVAPPASPHQIVQLASLAVAVGAGPLPAWALTGERAGVDAEGREWIELTKADRADRAEITKRWNDGFMSVDAAALRSRYEYYQNAGTLAAWFGLYSSARALKRVARAGLPSRPRIAADLAAVCRCNDRRGRLAAIPPELDAAFADLWNSKLNDIEALAALLVRVAAARRAVESYRLDNSNIPAAASRTALSSTPDAARAAWRAAWRAVGARAIEVNNNLVASLESISQLAAFSAWLPSPDDAAFAEKLRGQLQQFQSALPMLRDWCRHEKACAGGRAAGLGPVVDALRAGRVPAQAIRDAVEKSILQKWTVATIDADPVLREFDGELHTNKIVEFRAADRAYLQLSRAQIVATLDRRRPAPVQEGIESSEPGKLLREYKKQRNHMALRKLFAEIPNLLPRLKPCFLMSPLSVAQYLPAGGRLFDLVVFDEASQIGPHDAIGAIARGRQVVIVGDSKQLPPTSFFERAARADEYDINEDDVEDLESILDEAEASGVPAQTLEWHYRSRHESLIEFSNRNYYESRLHVFPAARGNVEDLGVKWMPVPDGIYEYGKSRANPREARVLVDWFVGALRATPVSSGGPERSFGIVTFSMSQQNLILDLLDEARRAHPEIEPHFSENLIEPVFVKNLENVQGDERDEILFSICYGPLEDGRVSMNFGPINKTGGQRRLNVAITRARKQLRVFSTLTSDMIDLTRTAAVGSRHLKAFLQFVEERSRRTAAAAATTEAFDSDFEREVYHALARAGHSIECQIGCGKYKIDLAVRDPRRPGEFILGIECDGAAYRSGATARDRDRLREQVLRNLGWRLHRIWSLDWRFHKDREIARACEAIRAALEDARKSDNTYINNPPPPAAPPTAVPQTVAQPPRDPAPAARPPVFPQYADAPNILTIRMDDLASAAAWNLSQSLSLTFKDLARATIRMFGLKMLTKRCEERMREVVEYLQAKGQARAAGEDRIEWTGENK